ncbi:MAG: hypothetical protein JWQ89_3335 [Devosia sp.]|uniref:hypothetical protein n=1 Tax=Devosia sp. TaxID=1871048 RepID=UPI002628BB15|nr:hypothetical protein [Devosia sp.]MDB5541608.1 hypothetical protein [Devosia sp.]
MSEQPIAEKTGADLARIQEVERAVDNFVKESLIPDENVSRARRSFRYGYYAALAAREAEVGRLKELISRKPWPEIGKYVDDLKAALTTSPQEGVNS